MVINLVIIAVAFPIDIERKKKRNELDLSDLTFVSSNSQKNPVLILYGDYGMVHLRLNNSNKIDLRRKVRRIVDFHFHGFCLVCLVLLNSNLM